MVLSEADHTQSRASPDMGVAERSKDAPRSKRPRGFLLSEDVEDYADKRNKGIDRRRYVVERNVL